MRVSYASRSDSLLQDDGDSDSESEQERLAEYESVLRENAPDFALDADGGGDGLDHDTPEWYQLHLAAERIKIPEILFQVHITKLTCLI